MSSVQNYIEHINNLTNEIQVLSTALKKSNDIMYTLEIENQRLSTMLDILNNAKNNHKIRINEKK